MSTRVSNNNVPVRTSPGRQPKRWSKTGFLLGLLAGILGPDLLSLLTIDGGVRRWGVIDELEQTLRLNRVQRKQIELVITETRQQYADTDEKLRELKNDARLAEIRRATRERIKSLLNIEQQLLFGEWVRQRDASRVEPHATPQAEITTNGKGKRLPLAA